MLKTAKEMTLESGKGFNINGASVTINSDGSATLNASQIELNGSIVQVGTGGLPALVLSTLFLGTGNLGAPVISSAVGPFSSAVFIAS